MPGAGRVKRRWLTSTVDRLFRAQQAATVTQRTDEIENKKICNGQPIDSGHAAHPRDPRSGLTDANGGVEPIDLFGRGDVDVNYSSILAAADNQATEPFGLAHLDRPRSTAIKSVDRSIDERIGYAGAKKRSPRSL